MKPFCQTGKTFFQVQIPTVGTGGKAGLPVKRALGTTDEVTAFQITAVIEWLYDKGAGDILDRITARKSTLSIAQLWAHWRSAPLQKSKRDGRATEPSNDQRLDHVRAILAAVDLDVLLEEWKDEGANETYVAQVRRMIPAGVRFPVEGYRRKTIQQHLNALPAGLNTKVHHRVAHSRFGQFLIGRELIDTNPARDVEFAAKLKRPYPKFHEEPAARALITAMDMGEAKALNALMFSTGIEWNAVEGRLTVSDVDTEHRMVFANGSKNDWRKRWVEVTEEWCWDIIKAYIGPMRSDALFVTKSWKSLRNETWRVSRALKLPCLTGHKWRHTFIAMWIDRGALGGLRTDRRDEAWLKAQVGHSPRSNLIRDTYGVRIRKAQLSAQQEERLKLARTIASDDNSMT